MPFLGLRSGSRACPILNVQGANFQKVRFLSRASRIEPFLLALCSHFLYFLFLGLPKTVDLKPPVGDGDLLAESSASRKIKEKKRKRAPSSLSSEKKKLQRMLVRKPKDNTSSQVLDSN